MAPQGWRQRVARLLAIAASTLPMAPAQALDPARPLAEFTLQIWGRDQGLPHGFVIDLVQSADGYLWASTWQGAARFNGREFVVFDERRLPWNRDGAVWSLGLGADGSLLLGSQRYGVSRLRDGRWAPEAQAADTPRPLLKVLEDREGRLWLGTRDGLVRIDHGQQRRFSSADGLPDAAVMTLSEAPDGSLWAGTGDGAARITGDVVERYGVAQGLPPGEIGIVLAAADGSVRVGGKQGAYRLEGGRFVRDPAELPEDEVTELLHDRHGTLWIGTVGNGVFRHSSRGLERLGAAQGLPSDHINTLLEDSQGNLWIGTHGGLAQLRETRFAFYSKREGLADDFVRAVAQSPDGSLWTTSNGGVSRILDGRIDALGERHPDARLSTLALLPRGNGELWFGTYSQGIRVLGSDGRLRRIGREQGLAGDEVRALVESRDGAVWAGTAAGVTRFDGDAARSWLHIGGSTRRVYVRALHEDRAGTLWLGTQEGLARIDGDRVVTAGDGGPPINVFGLAECEHGAIWVLGAGGIARWQDARLQRLPSRHGFDDNTVFGLVADGRGTDWLSTSDGLIALGHAELERAIDDPAATLPRRRYGDGRGPESLSLNGGSMPTSTRARDGRLWLATAQGVAVFDPDQLDAKVDPPPIVIERVQVDGADREPGEATTLPPGTRRVQFDYAGLSFHAPEALRYRHRLLGYDADWVEAGPESAVSYTNLVPGDYRFEVEAVVDNANAPPRRAVHAFHLAPYPYQTTSFRFSAALGLVAIGMLLYRRRTRALREQASTLQRLVDQRTAELQQRSAGLERADREKAELIERLQEQSARLARHALEDGLTGLANRRRLDAALDEAMARCRAAGQPLALALIDIDHFKRINDACGHGIGDEVLRRVAALIGARTPATGLAGRYGGEEFAVVLPDTLHPQAIAFAEALREAVAAHRFSDLATDLAVSISIGVASDDGRGDPGSLCTAADRHLYDAKRNGRNRVGG